MKRIPVRQAISHIAKIGYKALELTLMPTWDTEPRLLSKTDRTEIRKQIGDLGLELSAVMESLRLGPNTDQGMYLERLRTAAEVAHELSPGAPAMIETAVGGRPSAWEDTKGEMADQLRVWAKTLEALKTVLAIKGHVGNALDRPEKVLWMLDHVTSPWIRICYDYSHYKIHELDLRKTMHQLVGRSALIHVKDSVGSEQNYRFLLPGDSGEIDYKEYAQILSEIGYEGPVMAEVSVQLSEQPGYDAVAAAKRCWDNLAPFFM
ncbi:MAG: sugar phosphate isomerase/epimerase [Bryobacteraceae bacterium]|nr:sugar phosphate isomerase/epimerase [Bryobacteraceae bacterium]